MSKLRFSWRESKDYPTAAINKEVIPCPFCGYEDLSSKINTNKNNHNFVSISCNSCGCSISSSKKDTSIIDLINDCSIKWNFRKYDLTAKKKEKTLYFVKDEKTAPEMEISDKFILNKEWDKTVRPDILEITMEKTFLKKIIRISKMLIEKKLFSCTFMENNYPSHKLIKWENKRLLPYAKDLCLDFVQTTIYKNKIKITLTFETYLDITVYLSNEKLEEIFNN